MKLVRVDDATNAKLILESFLKDIILSSSVLTVWKINNFSVTKNFTWNQFPFWSTLRSAKWEVLRGFKYDSAKLISRKICQTEKSWNFHTERLYLKQPIDVICWLIVILPLESKTVKSQRSVTCLIIKLCEHCLHSYRHLFTSIYA